ncbi:MAG: T9SS C-terminal target domain-containing protein [Cytophagales bacterium]|nr:MAG: T9SS C-terminal target domain-containing protein [Cytophagales bacterium]TAF60039.1 MAG: T9SS C-terminal target domain-containing protein [Cytophagales bacterium]
MRNFKILFLFILITAFGASSVRAQLFGGSGFMQGDFLEVGVSGPCGNFGPPVTFPGAGPVGIYHGNAGFPLTVGFVCDVPKNGWDVAGPASGPGLLYPLFCGDYFVPGAPVEGWTVEHDALSFTNTDQGCFFNEVPGGMVSVTTAPDGAQEAIWQGTTPTGLAVRQRSFFRKDKTFFVTEIILTNTTAAPMTNVFYARNVDPDNDVSSAFALGGFGSFTTQNRIVFQGSPTTADALVEGVSDNPGAGTGTSGCYLGLGTRDTRARVNFGNFGTIDDASVYWDNAEGAAFGLTQTLGAVSVNDEAINIGFKCKDLDPGECDRFAFIYIMGEPQLEEALLEAKTVDLGNDVIVCNQTSFVLDAGPGFTNYLWDNGVTTRFRTVTETGLYSVEVTDGSPCPIKDEIVVTFNLSPDLSLVPATATLPVMYIGDSAAIMPLRLKGTPAVPTTGSPYAYKWFRQDAYPFAPFSTAEEVDLLSPGDYVLEVNAGPCVTTKVIRVTSPLPEPGFVDPYTPVLTGEAGNEKAFLSWNAPTATQNIAGFEIFGYNESSQLILVGTTRETNYTVPALLNGSDYSFVVRPILGDANGNPSSARGEYSNIVTVRPSIILGQNGKGREMTMGVFPNPNNGIFRVNLYGNQAKDVNVQVVSAMGQMVFEKSYSASAIDAFQTELDLSHLANGMYVVRVFSANGIVQERVNIQK